MSRYADEIDRANAHELLGKERASTSDPRWAWAHVRAMHYSECPYYSLLSAGSLEVQRRRSSRRNAQDTIRGGHPLQAEVPSAGETNKGPGAASSAQAAGLGIWELRKIRMGARSGS